MKPPAANTASRPFAAFCGYLLVGCVQEAIAANPEALVTATISERMWLLLLYSRSPSREGSRGKRQRPTSPAMMGLGGIGARR